MDPPSPDVLPRRLLVFGGEPLERSWLEEIRALAPSLAIVNHYGPAETTVGVLSHAVTGTETLPRIPIGTPLSNTVVRLWNAAFVPVPIGATGEIFIGGAGVARGYLGSPALTAERFVPDPEARIHGERLYRTGDLGQMDDTGELYFLGRVDRQVKIRGFRVEPAEVTAAILKHSGVRQAAVIAAPDARGDTRLVAYVVPAAGNTSAESEIRAFLKTQLPDHMVPTAWVQLDALPLTPSGKLDAGALPTPTQVSTPEDLAPTQSPVRDLIAGIWAEVLGVPGVGRRDDFFALGGHSLLATQAVSRMRRTFGVELPLRAMFDSPTVDAMVDVIRGMLKAASAASPQCHAARASLVRSAAAMVSQSTGAG